MPKATAPVDVRTPIRFQQPDQTTAIRGFKAMGVDDRRDGVGRVVEAVDELEAERDQHRNAEQQKRHNLVGPPPDSETSDWIE